MDEKRKKNAKSGAKIVFKASNIKIKKALWIRDGYISFAFGQNVYRRISVKFVK